MPEQLAAPALTLALFLSWGAIGYAFLSILRSQTNVGQNLLVAPAVGAGLSVLPLFWLSWIGLPVAVFGPWLAAGFLVVAAVLLAWRRPVLPPRRLLQLALPVAAAFALIGWPLARNGFAWLSYANDDMTNYCLLAERLLHYGLVEAPSAEALARGADFSLVSWFLEADTARPGSQLVLAWIASIANRPLPELFMPVIVALHLTLVSAAGALVYRTPRARGAALATCWLLAVSALTTLGTVSQLIAQVFGLALACGLLAITCGAPRRGTVARAAVLPAALGTAFLLVYVELAPFVGAAILGYLAIGVRRRTLPMSQVVTLLLAGSGALLLLAPYAERAVSFFLGQARSGVSGSEVVVELFPYYLLPSGLADIWGFRPIAGGIAEPWTSLAIAAGAILLVAAFAWTARLFALGEPAAAATLPMFLVGVALFWQQSAFGLFKLAMFAQPFLLGTIAVSLVGERRSTSVRAGHAMLMAIALPGLATQSLYTWSSVDEAMERGAVRSQTAVVHDLRRLSALEGASLDVDFSSMVLAKLQSLYTRGTPVRFIGHDFGFGSRRQGDPLGQAVGSLRAPRRFDLLDPADPSRAGNFTIPVDPTSAGSRPPCDTLLTAPGAEPILNRFRYSGSGTALTLQPCAAVRDHLAFISTQLGRHNYGAGEDPVAIHGLERDYFVPDRTMAGIGRYLLFEVINPSPSVRLLLNLSASLKGDGVSALPPAYAIGQTRVPFELAGRGSARVYSPPLVPRVIDGRFYIALDLGVDGTRYPDVRRGLMALFGRDIPRDPRWIVAVARNISLVSESEYGALTPPVRVAAFPRDLGDPALQYSGLYEDGWVAEDAYARLTRPAGASLLVVRGDLAPDASSGNTLSLEVRVDGEAVARVDAPGRFEVRVPAIESRARPVRVSLHASSARSFSPLDRRPASARLDFLGFEPAGAIE